MWEKMWLSPAVSRSHPQGTPSMTEPGDRSARASRTQPVWLLRSQWISLMLGGIAVVSAIAAFAAVRAWYVPVRAAVVVPATLNVDTQPAGAELLIDREPHGRTPASFSLPPGAHTLAVRAAGI